MLLGSPRKEGNSETLADALAAGAAEKGYEVRKVRLAGNDAQGCLDCAAAGAREAPAFSVTTWIRSMRI